jgi:hypothetical protein
VNVIQKKVRRFVANIFVGRTLTIRKFGARKKNTVKVKIITAEISNSVIPIIILKVDHEFSKITTHLNLSETKGFWHLPGGKVFKIHILGLSE